MHRFYVGSTPLSPGAAVTLSPEESRHLAQVLRMKAGDQAQLIGDGQRWQAEVVSALPEEAVLRATAPLPAAEPALRVTLCQGLPKGDKMERIIQKAVELGAVRIIPVAMQRSVVRLSAADAAKKRERWQRIAREACKQSGRSLEPEVSLPRTPRQLAAELGDYDAVLVPWEESDDVSLTAFRAAHPDAGSIALIIGPEGGMDITEVALFREVGAVPVTLGPRILRTETAGPAALSVLMALYGEMEATPRG